MANMSLVKNPMPSQDPNVRNKNFDEVALGYTAEQAIDDITEALRQQHVERLKQHKCSAKNGMIYLDILTNLERIGDHAENIATSVGKAQSIHHIA